MLGDHAGLHDDVVELPDIFFGQSLQKRRRRHRKVGDGSPGRPAVSRAESTSGNRTSRRVGKKHLTIARAPLSLSFRTPLFSTSKPWSSMRAFLSEMPNTLLSAHGAENRTAGALVLGVTLAEKCRFTFEDAAAREALTDLDEFGARKRAPAPAIVGLLHHHFFRVRGANLPHRPCGAKRPAVAKRRYGLDGFDHGNSGSRLTARALQAVVVEPPFRSLVADRPAGVRKSFDAAMTAMARLGAAVRSPRTAVRVW